MVCAELIKKMLLALRIKTNEKDRRKTANAAVFIKKMRSKYISKIRKK